MNTLNAHKRGVRMLQRLIDQESPVSAMQGYAAKLGARDEIGVHETSRMRLKIHRPGCDVERKHGLLGGGSRLHDSANRFNNASKTATNSAASSQSGFAATKVMESSPIRAAAFRRRIDTFR